MIFDENFLPKDNGADDYKDSARLAGLMALFGHPQAPDLEKYIVNGKPTRHPMYSPKDFSRDQLIPFLAGYKEMFGTHKVFYTFRNYRPTNGDWLSPSQKNHIKLCCGEDGSWFGYLWLWCDILWSAYIDPLAEPNQLISMLVVAGPKWIQRWKKLNKNWDMAIWHYWSTWRDEPDFAKFMIDKLQAY